MRPLRNVYLRACSRPVRISSFQLSIGNGPILAKAGNARSKTAKTEPTNNAMIVRDCAGPTAAIA